MPDNLEPGWLWMIGGILLLIAAALATGAFTLLFGLGLPAQLTLFTVYALVAVMIGRRIYANAATESSDPLLNDRSARLVGKSVTVIEAVDEHSGRVRVGDSEWSARGGPGRPGERVRITGVDGNCLLVEPDRQLPNLTE